MSYFIVDVESDNASTSIGSIVCFGAVRLDLELKTTFYGKCKPINSTYNPKALSISGFSREQHLTFDDPKTVFEQFNEWIKKSNIKDRPIFMSDNLAFDFEFINFYFHKYLNTNPFGYSGRRIGDLWSGFRNDMAGNNEWKKFRKTAHNHHPVSDSLGNAEALLEMIKRGLNFKI